MNITIGYIEEPPFYWTEPDGSVVGANIELTDVVLRAIGYTYIKHQPTTFEMSVTRMVGMTALSVANSGGSCAVVKVPSTLGENIPFISSAVGTEAGVALPPPAL